MMTRDTNTAYLMNEVGRHVWVIDRKDCARPVRDS